MIQKLINKTIPFVCENFITFPLWEEGKYIPNLNFWIITKEPVLLYNKLYEIYDDMGYDVIFEDKTDNRNDIYTFSISPKIKENDDCGYEFLNKDWSIEEILILFDEYLASSK